MPTQESDTTDVDNEAFDIYSDDTGTDENKSIDGEYVKSEFARRLRRELNAANQTNQLLEASFKYYKELVVKRLSCVATSEELEELTKITLYEDAPSQSTKLGEELLEGIKQFKQNTHLHLGNMLDETITTKRGDWPRELFCVICDCNVSKCEEHKDSCKIGEAYKFWDELDSTIAAQQQSTKKDK